MKVSAGRASKGGGGGFCSGLKDESSRLRKDAGLAVLIVFSVGDDSCLHAVPAGNLQSPSGLWRAEKSHDRFNIREKRKGTVQK
jgi:hypothetical protein